MTQHSSVFCNGSASLFYKCCEKQRSAKSTAISWYGSQHHSLLMRYNPVALVKILAARRSTRLQLTRKRHTRASGGPTREPNLVAEMAAVATEEPTLVAETLL